MCKGSMRTKQIIEMSVDSDDFVENTTHAVEMSAPNWLMCIK